MDGWLDGRMDGRMDERMGGRMENGWMDGQMDRGEDGLTDGWENGQSDGWEDGLMGEGFERGKEISYYFDSFNIFSKGCLHGPLHHEAKSTKQVSDPTET